MRFGRIGGLALAVSGTVATAMMVAAPTAFAATSTSNGSTGVPAALAASHSILPADGKDDYGNGYRDGYRKGHDDGLSDAKDDCRQDAKRNFSLRDQSDYERGYADGYNTGYSGGYNFGYSHFCEFHPDKRSK